MRNETNHKGPAIPQGFHRVLVPTPVGEIVEYGPPALLSDHATRFMIDHLEIPRSACVAEVGCGTGVLSVYAARSGAMEVTGTDIDDVALAAARLNGRTNGAPHIRFLKGSLLEPVSGPLDMILALLPHKPAPQAFDHRYYGGEDGTDLLLPTISQAAKHLLSGGVLYLYLNSIANEIKVMGLFLRLFHVSLAAEKKRYFTREEFDSLVPGMFEHLEGLKRKGVSDFSEDGEGLFFMARVYRGVRR